MPKNTQPGPSYWQKQHDAVRTEPVVLQSMCRNGRHGQSLKGDYRLIAPTVLHRLLSTISNNENSTACMSIGTQQPFQRSLPMLLTDAFRLPPHSATGHIKGLFRMPTVVECVSHSASMATFTLDGRILAESTIRSITRRTIRTATYGRRILEIAHRCGSHLVATFCMAGPAQPRMISI